MGWFFLTLIAALFTTAENIIGKKTLRRARTLEFSAIFAIGVVLISSPLLFKADFSQITISVLVLILLASLPATFSALLVFKSLKHNEMSEVAPIFALLPLVVTVFAFIFLGEVISFMQIAGMILMVGGIAFLEIENFQSYSGIFRKGRGKYLLYVVLSLIFGGITAIFDRIILYRFQINPLAYLIIIQFFVAFIYVAVFFHKSSAIKSLMENIKIYWKVIIVISLIVFMQRYLYANAIKIAVSMGIVVAVYKLSALSSIIAGGKFFAEKNIFHKLIAGLVVLGGIFLLVVK